MHGSVPVVSASLTGPTALTICGQQTSSMGIFTAEGKIYRMRTRHRVQYEEGQKKLTDGSRSIG